VVRVCVCHFVKMRSKKVRQKNILAQVNIYNRSFLLFAREEDGAIISLVKCKHD
jgi:hypothetical protein